MGRWLNKIQKPPETIPSKPSKPPFDSFEGTVNGDPASNHDIEKLKTALTIATDNLSITTAEVYESLSYDDIKSFQSSDINIEALVAFSRSIIQHKEMKKGKKPAHFTNSVNCSQCGHIWHWIKHDVNICPWCVNRKSGDPIPRPGD